MSVQEAAAEAMADMRALEDPYVAHINLIAMDKDGNTAGASYRPEKLCVCLPALVAGWPVLLGFWCCVLVALVPTVAERSTVHGNCCCCVLTLARLLCR